MKHPSQAPLFTRPNMLGASCSLKVSEIVLTEWSSPGETEDVMALGSSKDASNSSVLMDSVKMESKPCSKSAKARSRKEQSSHPGSRGKWVSDDTLPVNPV